MKLPPHTCPMIDRVKKVMQDAYKIADLTLDNTIATVEQLRDALEVIEYALRNEAEILEDIRDANLALRTAAEHYRAEAEKAEIA